MEQLDRTSVTFLAQIPAFQLMILLCPTFSDLTDTYLRSVCISDICGTISRGIGACANYMT